MDGFNTNKKYESFKIPGQQQFKLDGAAIELPQTKSAEPVSLDEGLFYEIEYDSCPMPGVGKFVLKSQKIKEPEKDEKRDIFDQMKAIASTHLSAFDYSRFFDQRVQHNNAVIFYKQGMFMKDFSDNYSGSTQFSKYFPYYHMMGYEQLRTYFTWRTEVRKGNVADISLSYAFLYIYELLGNIGVSDPQDGLNQLMSFWKAFSAYNKSIDKYVLRWLKDYHIYYTLPHSFKEFIDTNNLTGYYPNMVDTDNNFDLFCSISKYDIRKSTFFTDDKVKLIKDCFYVLINKLSQIFVDNGIHFDESIFQPTKKMSEWKPFKDALFYQWMKQVDRRIVLSENEIYICNNNKWTFSTVIASENGRQLIGYIMKQMEVVLRKLTNYKFKLSANIDTVTHEAICKLKQSGLSIEIIVSDAVNQFYKEATKTVVIVDQAALSRIRQEALDTQEKLIVPEQEKQFNLVIPVQKPLDISGSAIQDMPTLQDAPSLQSKSSLQDTPSLQSKSSLQNTPSLQDTPSLQGKSSLQNTPSLQGETILQDIPSLQGKPFIQDRPLLHNIPNVQDNSSLLSGEILPTPVSNTWVSLKNILTKIEIGALSVVLHNEKELKKYADECGIMLEVLVDGINEKAMDFIGDNLLDEEFVLYDDYKEQVKELIE